MDVKYFSDSFMAPAGTGNVSYTGTGFTPKAVIFFHNRDATTGTGTGSQVGAGFCVATSNACIFVSDRNTANPSESVVRHDNTKIILGTNQVSATILEAASLVSLDPDGFTLNWSAVSVASIVGYLAIGDGVTNAAIKELTSPVGTGSVSYTGVGFQPDAIIGISAGFTTAPPNGSIAVNGYSMLSVAGRGGGIITQSATGMFSADAVSPTNTSNFLDTNCLISMPGASETIAFQAALTSFDNDGFTANWTTTSGGAYFWFLCLKGLQLQSMAARQKTTIGAQAYAGSGFTPKGLIVFGGGNVPTTVPLATARMHFGLGSSATDAMAYGVNSLDGVAAGDCDKRNREGLIVTLLNNTATVIGEATITSLDQNGVTLNWSATDGTAREFIIAALGNSNTGGMFHTF